MNSAIMTQVAQSLNGFGLASVKEEVSKLPSVHVPPLQQSDIDTFANTPLLFCVKPPCLCLKHERCLSLCLHLALSLVQSQSDPNIGNACGL